MYLPQSLLPPFPPTNSIRPLADARKTANCLLATTERQCEALRSNILATARSDAAAIAQAAVSGARDCLEAALARLDAAYDERISQLANEGVAAVFDLAQHILGEALAAEPSSVRARLERALRQQVGASEVLVQIHPDDWPLFEKPLEALSGRPFTLAVSLQLSRGSFRIEAGGASVESAPLEHLQRIRAATGQ